MADIAAMFSRWASSGLSSLLGRSRAQISTSSAEEALVRLRAVADLQRVMRLLPRIQAVLLDAEKREMRDESVKLWLKELKTLAYDADDIIDEYDYEILKARLEAGDGAVKASCKRKRSEGDDGEKDEDVLQVPISDCMANKLMEIRERFEEIARDREALCLREEDGVMIRPFDPSMRPPPTSSHVDELSIRGREEEKKKLIEQLISSDYEDSNDKQDNKGSVVVIPIVGMGGIGKTTLAQLIYNDSRICEHFSCRGWVCVSESFDVVRIMKELIESITEKSSCENNNKTSLDCLHSSLKEELAGKRTLIVLDDVWNEDRSLWDSFSSPLHGFGAAIKIIITIRNEGVADVARTTPSFHLGLLSEEESWLLFKQCAGFDYREDADAAAGDQITLVKIGKMIVNKCGNLPLAVKLVGSHLRFEKDEERWNEILESDMWELDGEGKHGILPALRLSYERMPAYLKPCFKYCSLFSKDGGFEKSNLIRLWMAQGYILPKGSKSLEKIGGEYVDELVRRSFFIENFSSSNFFVMHDLVVDLARSIAGEEFAVVKLENGKSNYNNIPNSVRHLAVHCDFNQEAEEEINSLLTRHAALRSLFYHGHGFEKLQFTNFMRLRTLEFFNINNFSKISESIGYLKHLRYLRFKGGFERFSEVVLSNTCNLLTLDLFYTKTVELPRDICKLVNLRHLLLPENSFLPRGIRKLTELRMLKCVTVKNGSDQCGRIGELKALEKLEGSCHLCNVDVVVDLKDLEEANLISKGNIRKLTFNWFTHPIYFDNLDIIIKFQANQSAGNQQNFLDKLAESVLETLQPHSNINELEIVHYPGSPFPDWISLPSFSRLTDILLEECINCEILPPLGQLPSLRRLRVVNWWRLQWVGREFVCGSNLFENATVKNMDASVKGFPSLEKLEFRSLSKWEEWSGVLDGDFPHLVHLEIHICPNLKRIDKIPSSSLKTLVINHCPLLTSLPTLPSKLSKLSVIDCWNLASIPGLQSSNFPCFDVQEKTALKELTVLNSGAITNNLVSSDTLLRQNLSSLRQLILKNCKILASLPGLQAMISLEMLEITGCQQLVLSQDHRLPSKLQSVILSDCWKLTSLPGLQEELTVLNSGAITNNLVSSDTLLRQNLSSLRQLILQNCMILASLPGLQAMISLEMLEITRCQQLVLSQDHRLPSKLQSVSVSDCWKLTSLPGLQDLCSLRSLDLERCPLLHLSPAERLQSVPNHVRIIDCCRLMKWCQLHDFDHIQEISAHKKLTIAHHKKDILEIGVDNLVSLESLYIERIEEDLLPEDDWLPSNLETLHVDSCPGLKFFPQYKNLSMLKQLRLLNCKQLASLPSMQELVSLENLEIIECPRIMFSPSERLPSKLHFLQLSNCPYLVRLPGLEKLASLKSLKLYGCPDLRLQPYEDFSSGHQVHLEITNCLRLKKWCQTYEVDYIEPAVRTPNSEDGRPNRLSASPESPSSSDAAPEDYESELEGEEEESP